MNIGKTLIEMMLFFLLALTAMTLPAMGATPHGLMAGDHTMAAPVDDRMAEGEVLATAWSSTTNCSR